MCTCIEEIKEEINAVHHESTCMIKNVSSDIDSFLDTILKIQSDICELNSLNDRLYKIIYDNYNSMSSLDVAYIKEDLKRTMTNLDELYIRLKKSKFYSGIKTHLKDLRESIDDIKEIYNDLVVFKVELPDNNHFNTISEKLNSL